VRRILVALAAVFVAAFPTRAFAGYTHYWTWLKKPEPAKLAACLDDMEKVVRARPDLVADTDEVTGPNAKFRVTLPRRFDDPAAQQRADTMRARMREAGLPELIEGEHIVFNGIGAQAHEPFVFPGRLGFNFTKTEWKPYDEVVTAALIVARAHFSADELKIASDGDWSEWARGRGLYEETFRKDAPNPLLAAGRHEPSRRENWLISAGILGLGVVTWLVTRRRRTFGS
jgi:hypothetical protein